MNIEIAKVAIDFTDYYCINNIVNFIGHFWLIFDFWGAKYNFFFLDWKFKIVCIDI